MKTNIVVSAASLVGMIVSADLAKAEADLNSANYVMHGCRAFLTYIDDPDALAAPKWVDGYLAGRCFGLIEGLIYFREGVCVSNSGRVTGDQAVHVVVQYIDERPARLNETFKQLALEALRKAWPCKR
jgi:hypothetical protein